MVDNILLGLQTALSPENVLWCFVGVLAGTVIGLLPGLGSSTGVAVLIPLTLAFEPVTALIMLAGIYYGAQYGGTITSVLISTPGEASSVVTTLDGYQMARRGRAGPALAIAAIGSFAAAIVSLLLLALVAPPLADFALGFGPPENLAVMVLGFATIISFSGDSKLKGLAMAVVGVLIATVGVDASGGTARFTFGNVNLLSGIPYVEVMIGLFAVGEVMYQIRQGAAAPIRATFRDMMITRADISRSKGAIVRDSGLGFLLGCLPGAGSTLASFLAYGVEKRVSKHKDEFGKGAIEGVAAPESANNAAANANFVPTLTLGIPGGATTAVLLGAFTV
jgi:putative tricarboxylic transport membrane protein